MCLCCAGQTHLTTQWMDERSLDCRPALHKVNQQRKSCHTDKRGLACLLHCIPLHWPATDVNVGHVDKLCLAKPMATPARECSARMRLAYETNTPSLHTHMHVIVIIITLFVWHPILPHPDGSLLHDRRHG